MRFIIIVLFVPLFGTMAGPVLAAGILEFESGPQQSVMIELYTSEGCSSCPPAEVRLNRYRNHAGLWNTYIPLAFHVDYWDYLGWKDPYSRKRYSERQRQYARLKRARTVYTPAFVVNGENWQPGWFGKQPPVPENRITGKLAVRVSEDTAAVHWQPVGDNQANRWRYHLALLGMGLKSRIRAGERAGSVVNHEFVVLDWKEVPSADTRVTIPLPVTSQPGNSASGLVVWVSKEGELKPQQAVGGYLTESAN